MGGQRAPPGMRGGRQSRLFSLEEKVPTKEVGELGGLMSLRQALSCGNQRDTCLTLELPATETGK